MLRENVALLVAWTSLPQLPLMKKNFADEKEEEIQIGFPTDVKHVAHIGWDGPSANGPSWVMSIPFSLIFIF